MSAGDLVQGFNRHDVDDGLQQDRAIPADRNDRTRPYVQPHRGRPRDRKRHISRRPQVSAVWRWASYAGDCTASIPFPPHQSALPQCMRSKSDSVAAHAPQAYASNRAVMSVMAIPSFAALGICTPPELYAFAHASTGPLASATFAAIARGFATAAGIPTTTTIAWEMRVSVVQAKAFLTNLLEPVAGTGSGLDGQLFALALVKLAGGYSSVLATDPTCASTACKSSRDALVQDGHPIYNKIVSTYGKLVLKAQGGGDGIGENMEDIMTVCDTMVATGMSDTVYASGAYGGWKTDVGATTGQCALVALVYAQYLQ
eukprot:3227572-Prymnesium_polylepis.1